MTFLLLLPGFYERKKSVWVVEMYQNALKKELRASKNLQ